MDHGLISDIAIGIMVAWALAVVAHALRQPLILAYLVAGFAIGPSGWQWVSDTAVQNISELGLILLLFMIGLEMDLKRILGAGRLITVTGVVQILGSFALGLGCFWWLAGPMGLKFLEVVYLSAAIALSSTVVVVKLLYDKRELNTLAGRITLGVLVLQDLFAILFLAVQPELADPRLAPIAWSLVKVLVLVAVAFAASRYALPPLFHKIARLPEIVTVGSLAWCFLIGGLGEKLGLSREMGALVAGVAISTFPYNLDVSAKVTSLRDFFVTLFFVGIGMTIPRPTLVFWQWAGVIAALVILTRLLTVFLPLYRMRQGHRASFMPALNLCQISEFSLVILALGATARHVSPLAQNVTAYAFGLLAVLSTYGITNADRLFPRVQRALKAVGLRDLDDQREAAPQAPDASSIFLLGFCWSASSMLEEMERRAGELLPELAVVDFNPNVNQELARRQVRVIYGDISQRDTLEHAGIHHAKVIVCTLSNSLLKGITNQRLVRMLRELNPSAKIIVHAEWLREITELYAAGADYVCAPRLLEGRELLAAVIAAQQDTLQTMRDELDRDWQSRREVIP